jgi:general secretion pathway protein D
MATDREAAVAMTRIAWAVLLIVCVTLRLHGQPTTGGDSALVVRGDSVAVRLVDVDLRVAIQALSRYVDRPVIFGGLEGAVGRVTLETPKPVPVADIARLLRGLVESQNLELAVDTAAGIYRVRPRQAPPSSPATDASAQQRAGPARGPIELFVVRLRHARAADVAATINALYGRASALGELGERTGGRAPAPGQELMPNAQPQVPPGAPPSHAVPTRSGQQAALAGEVTIVPDPGTNSLLIRATRGDFDLLQAAVSELDVRPLQVLIEVAIVEARRDRSFNLSTGIDVPQSRVGDKGNTTVGGSVPAAGLSDIIATVLNVGGMDLSATLRVAASRGDVKILSTPIVIAANNEQAEILVGSQRPFIQVQRTLPTSDAVRDQIVQYKEVGTRLSVRPTISADGYVMLEISQEVNAATSEQGLLDAPVISTRTLQTRLLVKDRQTVALGGLSDTQRERNSGGIPILSSIPLIGGVFGRSSRRVSETALFLFLTPRVIRDDGEAESLSAPLRKKAERIEP